MFCAKCGAAVVGKFCSCCGYKVRSQVDEYNAAEKRMRNNFVKSCSCNRLDLFRLHLAEACWLACVMKYGKGSMIYVDDHFVVSPFAYDNLETTKVNAERLFEHIVTSMGF